MSKIKIGIFLGGSSREREISFIGGRTVFDNLNRELFEPIPIFVDHNNNLFLLPHNYLYQGSIRDFLPGRDNPYEPFQVYSDSIEDSTSVSEKLGKEIIINELPSIIDFAFLILHGHYGEDGTIQGLLEWLKIPFSGSNLLGSAIGISKSVSNDLLNNDYHTLSYTDWVLNPIKEIEKILKIFDKPFVVKSNSQGSSIGVSIVPEEIFHEAKKIQGKRHDDSKLIELIDKAFFRIKLRKEKWDSLTKEKKENWIQLNIIDIKYGISMPVVIDNDLFYNPLLLFNTIEKKFLSGEDSIMIESYYRENKVILEKKIEGQEFSCIVVEDIDGTPIALPPTGVNVQDDFFSYRAKYMPGISNKVTPIDVPKETLDLISKSSERILKSLHFDIFARIDGFVLHDGGIIFNDPNTTAGMSPSTFLFHQAAEIGLLPHQFLTYIVYRSIQKAYFNRHIGYSYANIIEGLKQKITKTQTLKKEKITIPIIMGGFNMERHISLESGRNVYMLLSSSEKYDPIPIFLSGSIDSIELYKIPINILLKDNADDVHKYLKNLNDKKSRRPEIKYMELLSLFGIDNISIAERVPFKNLNEISDFCFLALHGRPGEDGTLQKMLDEEGIKYNGSSPEVCATMIDKYLTNQKLCEAGFKIAKQFIISIESWTKDKYSIIDSIKKKFHFPFIIKPVDEGCSAMVSKVESIEVLLKNIDNIFRTPLPALKRVLIEEYICAREGERQIEITCGFLTQNIQGKRIYKIFEPSESIAFEGILSLEEKFLAGEGQNITPPRYHKDPEINNKISGFVKERIKKIAQILNLEGYARIDAFLKITDKDEYELYVIEVNNLPALTPATCIFHQAAHSGYTPYQFLDMIIKYSLSK